VHAHRYGDLYILGPQQKGGPAKEAGALLNSWLLQRMLGPWTVCGCVCAADNLAVERWESYAAFRWCPILCNSDGLGRHTIAPAEAEGFVC